MAECPGVYALAEMKDGLLARIRVRGGILTSKNLKDIANASVEFGSGDIDFTNRSNLQIRGIKKATHQPLINYLIEKELITNNPDHDRLRNITIDPLSGLIHEHINCHSLALDFDDALASSLKKSNKLTQLSPKFSTVFDGGGETNIAAMPHDLCLYAHKDSFELLISGAPTDLRVKKHQAISALITLIENLGNFSETPHLRMKSIMSKYNLNQLIAEIEQISCGFEKANGANTQKTELKKQPKPSRDPIKIADKNTFAITLTAPTSRLIAHQLLGLAEITERWGSGQVRLTPWQSVIIEDVKEENINTVWHAGEAGGFLTQPDEQNLHIISCAGSTGCIHGNFETIQQSLEIREAFIEKAFPLPLTIHLSACEKGCASRKRADYLIMQKKGESNSQLYLNAAPNTSKPGKTISSENLTNELYKLI